MSLIHLENQRENSQRFNENVKHGYKSGYKNESYSLLLLIATQIFKFGSWREISLTEAKPVLISPRSPRDAIDCSWLDISEPASACWEPWRLKNPQRVQNFNWFWNGIIGSWKFEKFVPFLLLIVKEVVFSEIIHSSLHLLVLNCAKNLHFK